MVAELVAAATVFGGHAPGLPLRQCTLARSVAARCGTLAVPEDRRQPSGRKIRIFVGILPALRRGSHAAPIFWLSGGPGGAAASDDARSAQTIFFAANRTRDIVLVDQRGVGRSAPLFCPVPTPADVDPLAYAQRCLRTVGRDPRLYTGWPPQCSTAGPCSTSRSASGWRCPSRGPSTRWPLAAPPTACAPWRFPTCGATSRWS